MKKQTGKLYTLGTSKFFKVVGSSELGRKIIKGEEEPQPKSIPFKTWLKERQDTRLSSKNIKPKTTKKKSKNSSPKPKSQAIKSTPSQTEDIAVLTYKSALQIKGEVLKKLGFNIQFTEAGVEVQSKRVFNTIIKDVCPIKVELHRKHPKYYKFIEWILAKQYSKRSRNFVYKMTESMKIDVQAHRTSGTLRTAIVRHLILLEEAEILKFEKDINKILKSAEDTNLVIPGLQLKKTIHKRKRPQKVSKKKTSKKPVKKKSIGSGSRVATSSPANKIFRMG